MKQSIICKTLAVSVILLFLGVGVQPSIAITIDGNSPPEKPDIIGAPLGKPGVEYDIRFCTKDPDGDNISIFVDWGDGTTTGWTEYFASESIVILRHTWESLGDYIIRAKAKDIHGTEGEWSDFYIEIPRTRASSYHWFLERFPILERLLSLLL